MYVDKSTFVYIDIMAMCCQSNHIFKMWYYFGSTLPLCQPITWCCKMMSTGWASMASDFWNWCATVNRLT